MGCSNSSDLKADPSLTVEDLARRNKDDALIGSHVQVMGHAKNSGTLLQSPFGERIGVAIAMQIYRRDQFGRKLTTFGCERTMTFSIGSDKGPRVEVQPGKWKLDLAQSWEEINIAQDPFGLGVDRIWSGGKTWAKYDEWTEKPHAHVFWKFYGHEDMIRAQVPPRRKDLADRGDDSAVQRLIELRGAVERVLYPGVPCVVEGKLGCDAEGRLTISPPGTISNRARTSPKIALMNKLPPLQEDELVRLVQLGDFK
jgi:hypothetical protein